MAIVLFSIYSKVIENRIWGAFYHVTSRGNQRGQVFWDDQDKDRFIKILRRTKER
jgi:REP element-mobilizing transposase RayT